MTLKQFGKNGAYGSVFSHDFAESLLRHKNGKVHWFSYRKIVIVWAKD